LLGGRVVTIGSKTRGHCECGVDVGAYVLGALERDELEAFRLHLAGCPRCHEEVASLQNVADTLPAAAPAMAAPADLRRRVIEAVREDPDAPRRAAPNRQRLSARVEQGQSMSRSTLRRRGFRIPRLAATVGGLLTAAATIVVLVVFSAGGTSSTRVIHASVRGPGTADLRLTSGRGELTVSHFPAPAAGRIYQVWLQRPNQTPTPTRTLFDVTTDGRAEVDVGGDLRGVSEVLVTPEPLGGSRAPTGSPVIIARLE
jgi:hypothetical protein